MFIPARHSKAKQLKFAGVDEERHNNKTTAILVALLSTVDGTVKPVKTLRVPASNAPLDIVRTPQTVLWR
jgi:hypothetical protein